MVAIIKCEQPKVRGIIMNLFLYLKAVIGAVGAGVLPPIFDWLVTFLPGNPPANVREAVSILLVALLTGGAVYATPNQQRAPKLGQQAVGAGG